MKRLTLIIAIVLMPLVSEAQISIRIFARTKPSTVVFTPVTGQYELINGSGHNVMINTQETVAVIRYNDRVYYQTLSGRYGVADSLVLRPVSAGSRFMMRAPARNEDVKILEGTLIVKSFLQSLLVLNLTDIENYLPGVVMAEAGRAGPLEYFRAQAVVARTYVYRNIERHILDGYNLCDDTHCQVYPGVISDSIISGACHSTAGLVIVDGSNTLIVAAFHGNCGGVTASSADVWVARYPYLVSIKDPWCGYSMSSLWRKSLPLDDWNKFLLSKGVEPGRESTLFTSAEAQNGRMMNFTIAGKHISKEEIRQWFNLRSSYFTLVQTADSIIVSGRGYGHGVGLCQDGAKAMASGSMTYEQITGFYYPGTRITDVKNARRPDRP